MGRVDLDNDFGPAVAIDVADADRPAGVGQARAVEIRLQRVTWNRDRCCQCAGLNAAGSNFITQKSFPPEWAASIWTMTSARPSPSTSPMLTDRPALGRPEQSRSACSV